MIKNLLLLAIFAAVTAFSQSPQPPTYFAGTIKGFVMEKGHKNEDIRHVILERNSDGKVVAERITVQRNGTFKTNKPIQSGPWIVKTDPPCAEITSFVLDPGSQKDVLFAMYGNDKKTIVKADDVGMKFGKMGFESMNFNLGVKAGLPGAFSKFGSIDLGVGGVVFPSVCSGPGASVPVSNTPESGK
jgi:hypothetical protein